MGQDVELWIRELVEAGWSKWRGNSTVWLSPDGYLYRGPYGAWCKMLSLRAGLLEKEGE